MAAPRPVKIGVGIREKRARILRSLEAHVRYLTLVESMTPWAPPERTERPQRPPDPDPYRMRLASHFYTPRERPELAKRYDGLAEVTEAQMAAYVAAQPFVRAALRPATVRALVYLESFAPRRLG